MAELALKKVQGGNRRRFWVRDKGGRGVLATQEIKSRSDLTFPAHPHHAALNTCTLRAG
jgi:hypothetical protein